MTQSDVEGNLASFQSANVQVVMQLGGPTGAALYAGLTTPDPNLGANGSWYFRSAPNSPTGQRLWFKSSASGWNPLI